MYPHKKILIVGDSGRGKSTFAEKLSLKISIRNYSTDDFYYVKKFSILNDRAKSILEIGEIYKKDSWIVEGTTKHLIQEGLEKADIIYLLEFDSIFFQYCSIIKRSFGRKHESWKDIFQLLKHITNKRFNKNYKNRRHHLHDLIEPYNFKIERFNLFSKINSFLNKL